MHLLGYVPLGEKMASYNVTWNISKVHWMLIEMFGHCSISPQQIWSFNHRKHLTLFSTQIRFLEQLVMYPFCFCPCHSGSTLTSHGSSWRKEKALMCLSPELTAGAAWWSPNVFTWSLFRHSMAALFQPDDESIGYNLERWTQEIGRDRETLQ